MKSSGGMQNVKMVKTLDMIQLDGELEDLYALAVYLFKPKKEAI